MKKALTFITLGVDNLETMKDFYTQKFGWKTMHNQGDIVFFLLNGTILSLYPNKELAADAGVPDNGKGFKRFTMAICLGSEKEVDETFSQLQKKGVAITKAPEKVFWGGYSGYVQDPENNLWEIAYNPFLKMDAAGNVTGMTE